MSCPFGVRPTETRIRSKNPALAVGELDLESVALRLDCAHRRAEQNRFVAAGDALVQRRDEVRVAARDQLIEQLDDRDPRAERVVYGRHLEPDDSAADDEQPLGDVRG